MTAPLDRLGRPLRDLRISVTDRCNFRCRYCMPREVFGRDYPFLPREDILSYEEIARLARLFAGRGVEKIRLTGGEPLLRRDLPQLVHRLAELPGVEVALTTNGALLGHLADELAEAGLARVTVSLDSLDDAVFRAMNDADFPVARVLQGIEAAAEAGLTPIKINAVVHRGVNDHGLVELARHFHGSGHIVRFIEYMDVGTSNGWRLDEVLPGAEIVRRIDAALPLEALPANYPGEVARRYRYRDGGGEIGVITSVTQPFCGACSRARLSAEGKLFTCLFAGDGADLRGPLRDGSTDDDLGSSSTGSGRGGRTAIPRSARTPPRACPGSRCRTSEASRSPPSGRGQLQEPAEDAVGQAPDLVSTVTERRKGHPGLADRHLDLARRRLVPQGRERHPECRRHLHRIEDQPRLEGGHRHERADHQRRQAAARRPHLVEGSEDVRLGVECQAHLLGRLAQGRSLEVLVARVTPAAGKRHVTRPGIVRPPRALDQQDLELRPGAQDDRDRGLAQASTPPVAARRTSGEIRRELAEAGVVHGRRV